MARSLLDQRLLLLLPCLVLLASAAGPASSSFNSRPRRRFFEVTHPLLGPGGPVSDTLDPAHLDGACSVLLMRHDFANSYGTPFVGPYEPPSCEFDRVVMNLTVASAGRQFDRLALMFLGDVEVWRTSTAEPVPAPGIVWTRLMDMTAYLSLWRQPQSVIFDLGNLVDDTYTAILNTTLTATFFLAGDTQSNDGDDEDYDDDDDYDDGDGDGDRRRRHYANAPADLIIPISARLSGEGRGSQWQYPGPARAAATLDPLPSTARRAVLTLSANGQIDEEFWWTNTLESDPPSGTDPAGGQSQFREVQALIDGQVAGVQWPFPVVFTGGYAPSMHRPIVGIGAFDLREGEIDVSAWLPVLCDRAGGPHEVEIRVMGIDNNGKGGPSLVPIRAPYWVLTGKLFVWLGGGEEDDDLPDRAVTGHAAPVVTMPDPVISYTSERTGGGGRGKADSVRWEIEISRTVAVADGAGVGAAGARSGNQTAASWSQAVSFSGRGYLAGDNITAEVQMIGHDEAAGSMGRYYQAHYSYPIRLVYTTIAHPSENSSAIYASLDQARDTYVSGRTVFPLGPEAFAGAGRYLAASIRNSRNSTALMEAGPGGLRAISAETRQSYTLSGYPTGGGDGRPAAASELYRRDVRAANLSVVSDLESARPIGWVRRVEPTTAAPMEEDEGGMGAARNPRTAGPWPRFVVQADSAGGPATSPAGSYWSRLESWQA